MVVKPGLYLNNYHHFSNFGKGKYSGEFMALFVTEKSGVLEQTKK
jgi:hypothetical protein